MQWNITQQWDWANYNYLAIIWVNLKTMIFEQKIQSEKYLLYNSMFINYKQYKKCSMMFRVKKTEYI